MASLMFWEKNLELDGNEMDDRPGDAGLPGVVDELLFRRPPFRTAQVTVALPERISGVAPFLKTVVPFADGADARSDDAGDAVPVGPYAVVEISERVVIDRVEHAQHGIDRLRDEDEVAVEQVAGNRKDRIGGDQPAGLVAAAVGDFPRGIGRRTDDDRAMTDKFGILHDRGKRPFVHVGIVVEPEIEVEILFRGPRPGQPHALVPEQRAVSGNHDDLREGLPDLFCGPVRAAVIGQIHREGIFPVRLHAVDLAPTVLQAPERLFAAVVDRQENGDAQHG